MEGPSGTAARNRLRSARSPARRGPSPSPPGARGRRGGRPAGSGRGVARESAAAAVATGAGAGVGAGDRGGALRFRPARRRTNGPTSPRRSRVFLHAPSGAARPSGSPASPGAPPPDRHRTGARRSCTSPFIGPRNRWLRCGKPSFPVRRSTISPNRNWRACCPARRTSGRRLPRLMRRRGAIGEDGGSKWAGGDARRAGARSRSPPHGLRCALRKSPVRFRLAPLNLRVWEAEFRPPVPALTTVLLQHGFRSRIAEAASSHSRPRG